MQRLHLNRECFRLLRSTVFSGFKYPMKKWFNFEASLWCVCYIFKKISQEATTHLNLISDVLWMPTLWHGCMYGWYLKLHRKHPQAVFFGQYIVRSPRKIVNCSIPIKYVHMIKESQKIVYFILKTYLLSSREAENSVCFWVFSTTTDRG